MRYSEVPFHEGMSGQRLITHMNQWGILAPGVFPHCIGKITAKAQIPKNNNNTGGMAREDNSVHTHTIIF